MLHCGFRRPATHGARRPAFDAEMSSNTNRIARFASAPFRTGDKSMNYKPLFRSLSVAAVLSIGVSQAAHAATEIQFWHAMEAALGERLNDIPNDFNKSQSDYKIVPVFKGPYDQPLAAGIAAYRSGNAPAI